MTLQADADPVAGDLSSDAAVVVAIERDILLLAKACYTEWALFAAVLPLCCAPVKSALEVRYTVHHHWIWHYLDNVFFAWVVLISQQ